MKLWDSARFSIISNKFVVSLVLILLENQFAPKFKTFDLSCYFGIFPKNMLVKLTFSGYSKDGKMQKIKKSWEWSFDVFVFGESARSYDEMFFCENEMKTCLHGLMFIEREETNL